MSFAADKKKVLPQLAIWAGTYQGTPCEAPACRVSAKTAADEQIRELITSVPKTDLSAHVRREHLVIVKESYSFFMTIQGSTPAIDRPTQNDSRFVPLGTDSSDVFPTERSSVAFSDQLRNPAVLSLLLGTFSFLLYCGTLAFQFVWDDRKQIIENAAIKAWSFVPNYFTANVWAIADPHQRANYYRPLFLLWLKINYSLFGLSPAGWHCTSVLLQALVTIQVFWLARKLFRSDIPAAVSALVFAVHPVHIESVVWVSGVTDPLVAAFMLGATLLFIRSLASESVGWSAYTGSLACGAFALLSKEIAVVLPFLLIASAITVAKDRDEFRITKYVAPFFVLTLVYLGVRHVVLHGLMHLTPGETWRGYLLTLPSLIFFYVRQLIAPFWISPYADVYWVHSLTLRQFWIPVSVCIALIVFAVAAYRNAENRTRVIAVLAWTVLPLLPALYVRVFSPSELVHDRYLYVSSVGFSIIIVLLAQKLAEKIPVAIVGVMGATAVAMLAVVTFQGEMNWASEILLYKYAVEMAPHNDAALINLGVAYLERGNMENGIGALKQALDANPNSALAASNLGHVFLLSHRYAEAEPMFRRAIRLDPTQEGWLEQFAEVELRLGKISNAEQAVRQAIRIRPDGEGFHLMLGAVLLAKGDRRGAEQAFSEEFRLYPQDATARNALQQLGQGQPKEVSSESQAR